MAGTLQLQGREDTQLRLQGQSASNSGQKQLEKNEAALMIQNHKEDVQQGSAHAISADLCPGWATPRQTQEKSVVICCRKSGRGQAEVLAGEKTYNQRETQCLLRRYSWHTRGATLWEGSPS